MCLWWLFFNKSSVLMSAILIYLFNNEYCQCRRQCLRFYKWRKFSQVERSTYHRLEEGKEGLLKILGTWGAPFVEITRNEIGNIASVICQISIFQNFHFFFWEFRDVICHLCLFQKSNLIYLLPDNQVVCYFVILT